MGMVCRYLHSFVGVISQAETDLELSAAAFAGSQSTAPAAAASASLLASPGGRAARRVGPCTGNGKRWREWWLRRYGRRQGAAGALLQTGSRQPGEEETPACERAGQGVPMQRTSYQIGPGSADGAVPPTEVRGDLFLHCRDHFDEISLGQPQPASILIQMARTWCGVQGTVPDPDDPDGFPRHPDWDFHACAGMGQLLALALREDFSNTAVGSLYVCKKLFLASGTLHRVDHMMREAWTMAGRSPGSSGLAPPSEDDPEQLALAKAARLRAQDVTDRLRRAKQAQQAVADAQAQVDGWEGGQDLATTAPGPTDPPLPSASGFPA